MSTHIFSTSKSTRYYRNRLWKVHVRVSRLGWNLWRFVKFYECRDSVGAPWRIVHHAVFEQDTPIT